MAKELTQAVIEQWVSLSTGTFNVKDIWSELAIITPEGKQHLRVILSRLEHQGIITKTLKDGSYRKISKTAKIMDWQSADPSKTLELPLPFDIHKYCKIYSKSVIIVTADKNQGKTAFMYKTLELNASIWGRDSEGNISIDFFNSETGVEQMKERLSNLDLPEPPTFNMWECYDNFADEIHPEHLTLIDYLDFNSEVYLVGEEIDKIFRKLTTGCAIIALQKPAPVTSWQRGKKVTMSRDLAYGGSYSAKRSALYITMGQNKLKLLYVKSPLNPRVNPNNMMWSFGFDESGYFTNIQRYCESANDMPSKSSKPIDDYPFEES